MDSPTVPFTFKPSASQYEKHLTQQRNGSVAVVRWPALGIELSTHPTETGRYPDLDMVQQMNGAMFKDWNQFGFSVADYHEFFCHPLPRNIALQMGPVQISFGRATPLAAYLYDNVFEDDLYGEWADVSSARITGCSVEDVEAVFISAALKYQSLCKILPTPYEDRDVRLGRR